MTNFKKCIFTICAKNNIGLAQILEKSISEFHKDVKFFIFIADEFESDNNSPKGDNLLISKSILNIDDSLWTEMSFKYDVVEFCTALKPFCFNYILELGYEKAIYLDPDILLFYNMDCVFDKLDTYSTIVVPHEINLSSDDPQRGGIYNLGFIAINNSEPAIKLMNWWGDRLKKYAFADQVRAYFTNQKWMDKLSVILDGNEYYVYKHLGLNYAPWNFDEREVFSKNGKYLVRLKSENNDLSYPLIFFHYSAFKYEELAFGNFKHKD